MASSGLDRLLVAEKADDRYDRRCGGEDADLPTLGELVDGVASPGHADEAQQLPTFEVVSSDGCSTCHVGKFTAGVFARRTARRPEPPLRPGAAAQAGGVTAAPYSSEMGRRSTEVKQRRLERESSRRRNQWWRETAEDRGCLFCRRGDGGFESAEHPVPESLGNSEIVLPRGVVCDRCNNGTLSVLDQVLCDFGPISMQRTFLGITSKSGKIPILRYSEGTVQHVPGAKGEDPLLIFKSNKKGGALRETARLTDGRVEFKWEGSGGRRMTPRYGSEVSRALLKSGFECSWFQHGLDLFGPHYDHIRAAVLGKPRNGTVLMMRKMDPKDTGVSLTYHYIGRDDGQLRLAVWGSFYGVWLATDSRLDAPMSEILPDHASVLSFTESDFRDI